MVAVYKVDSQGRALQDRALQDMAEEVEGSMSCALVQAQVLGMLEAGRMEAGK